MIRPTSEILGAYSYKGSGARHKKPYFLFAEKLLRENNIDRDLVDLDSLFDSSLTLAENKNQFLTYLSELVPNIHYDDEQIAELTREQCRRQLENIQRQRDLEAKGKPTVKLLEDVARTEGLLDFSGFSDIPDIAERITNDMMQRCRHRFLSDARQTRMEELQNRAEERGPYPASIKGLPTSPPETLQKISPKKLKFCHFSSWRETEKGKRYKYCDVRKCLCTPLDCDVRFQTDLDRTQRFDFFPLVKGDFTIPGMGEAGGSCCAVDNERIGSFSEDYKKLKIHRVVCKRVECPQCYKLWIKTRTFEITLALEIMSFIREERPFSVVSSIRPKEVYFNGWNWNNVNHSLFNRAYRRGHNIGIDGGFVMFHPFRIRKSVKKTLRSYSHDLEGRERRLSEGDAGLWRMIRKDVLDYGSFYKYVKVGPHVHSVAFGKPKGHTDKEFFIGVQDEIINGRKTGRPLRLKTTQDVVAKVMYLLTHCGVSTLKKIIQPTRRYGCMYDFQVDAKKQRDGTTAFTLNKLPEEQLWRVWDDEWRGWFEKEWIPEKCREIAELIGMQWSDDEGLELKDDSKGEDIVWLPIWKIYHCIHEIREELCLSWEIRCFYETVLEYMEKFGRPPPTLPQYKMETSSLYWAASYLTGLVIPDDMEIVSEEDGEDPEDVINRVEPNQEQELTIGKTLNERTPEEIEAAQLSLKNSERIRSKVKI